jgi:16S rRNA (guanine527-N7)-methyltransferase
MQDKLWQYLLLLKKWNQVYNLTAIRDLDEMISHHVLDSLAIAPYLNGVDFIDVGTGPGLPGIPLSIIMPNKRFTLLDSNSKKTAFLLQAKAALKLDNMQVVCSRVEDYAGSYDGVLSRAFTAVHDFVASTQHLLKKDGAWYAMKGPQYIDEVKAISNFSHNTLALTIPFLAKERFLTIIKNTGAI